MKRYINKSIILLLTMVVSALLLCIGATAAGEVYKEADGVNTAYLSDSETITLSDGSTRNTYQTLTSAIKALGTDGGRVYVCGTVNDATANGSFADVAGRTGKLYVTGLSGNGTDAINYDYTLDITGPSEFDNFKLNCTFSGGRYVTGGAGDTVFGPGFTTGGKIYYRNYKTLASTITSSRTVFNTTAAFVQVSAGGGSNAHFGTASATEPVLAEIVVNNIMLNTNSFIVDYNNNADASIFGNVNIIINNGTFPANASLSSVKGNTITGVVTGILNNGNAKYFTSYAPVFDYIVKSAVGGTVSINKQAPFGGTPEFLFTPDSGMVPTVNGEAVSLSDGKYLYTPNVSEAQTILEVEWIAAEPEVYEINGEKCAFVKNGGGTVTYNGERYFAFTDVNTAVAALGTYGGNVYISGTVSFIVDEPTDTNTFADIAGRNELCIYGIDGTEPVLNYYRSMELQGNLTIDKLTYHRLNGSLYDTGFLTKGYNLTLGENFKTTSDFAAQVMTIHGSGSDVTFDTSTITINGGTLTRVAPGSTYSGITVNGDTVININGGTIATLLGGSHGGAAKDSVYIGDVTYNISGGRVDNIYTGVNMKTGIDGNVTVNISGGNFAGTSLIHGNVNNISSNYLDGNSIYVITGGTFSSAVLGDGNSRGVIGEEIFIVSNDISGYTYKISSKGTFIKFDPEGTVTPAFDDDGTFLGYEIICEDTELDIVIDNVKYEPSDDNIYTIGRGDHTVEFLKPVTVSFDLLGAEGTHPEDITVYEGDTIALDTPDAHYDNHVFIGWNTSRTASEGFMTYVVPAEDTTLYAVWSETKPELEDAKDIVNSGASHIDIISIPESKYETHSSVISSAEYIKEDVLLQNGGSIVYAFSVGAFDENDNVLAEYDNGIDFRIPKSVLSKKNVGQFYRIYKLETTADVTLMSEDITVIPYTEDENFLYFTDETSGDYAVVIANEYNARYIYKGRKIGEKYILELYFDDADACCGTFGLKYDTSAFTLDNFVFEDTVTEYGNISVADGGFGTYYNENGIYQNTWKTDEGIFASGEADSVRIGTFTFTLSNTFSGITDTAFACADFEETNIELDQSVLETVWQHGSYLYAPMLPSIDVYCQPTKAVFEYATDEKLTVTANFVLERESINSFISDSETGIDSSARIELLSGDSVIVTAYEKDLVITENENGKAVINFSARVTPGVYKIVFTKNGYVPYTYEFAAAETSSDLGTITPICGDVKADYTETCGDESVDIDDFIRVLRGFANNNTKKLCQTVDLNEDGVVNVADIAIIKANFMKQR